MFNDVLVTVKPADKRHRTYKHTISARLHRGFQMFRSPKKEEGLGRSKVTVYQQAPLLNISSGEDAFLEKSYV